MAMTPPRLILRLKTSCWLKTGVKVVRLVFLFYFLHITEPIGFNTHLSLTELHGTETKI